MGPRPLLALSLGWLLVVAVVAAVLMGAYPSSWRRSTGRTAPETKVDR